MTLSLLVCACGGDGAAETRAGSEPDLAVEAAESRKQYVGRTRDGRASLALVRAEGQVLAYVCDDDAVSEWFEAAASDHLTQLAAKSGARLELDAAGDFGSGTFVDALGNETRFEAAPAQDGQGLFVLAGEGDAELDTDHPEQLSVEQLLHAAIAEKAREQLGLTAGFSFRAGWIVTSDTLTQGNVSVRSGTTQPLGNALPLDKEQLTLASELGLTRLMDALAAGGSLDELASTRGPSAPFTPFFLCHSVDFSAGYCERLIAVNRVLLAIDNALGGKNDALDALLNAELSECANELIDFCA